MIEVKELHKNYGSKSVLKGINYSFYGGNIYGVVGKNGAGKIPLNEYIEHYSTGMLKKLAFMALLLQKNDIYILDEPFNGVDIQSNIILSAVIQKLKLASKTVLISSHIFSSLQENCDEICVLNNGTIEETVRKEDFNRLGEQLKNEIVDRRLDQLEL